MLVMDPNNATNPFTSYLNQFIAKDNFPMGGDFNLSMSGQPNPYVDQGAYGPSLGIGTGPVDPQRALTDPYYRFSEPRPDPYGGSGDGRTTAGGRPNPYNNELQPTTPMAGGVFPRPPTMSAPMTGGVMPRPAGYNPNEAPRPISQSFGGSSPSSFNRVGTTAAGFLGGLGAGASGLLGGIGSGIGQGISNFLGGLSMEDIANAGLGAGALAAIYKGYDDLGGIGDTAYTRGSEIAQQGLEQTQFKPFTVTSSTGGMFGAGQDGSVGMVLSPQEQAIQNSLMSQAQQGITAGFTGDPMQQAAAQQAYGLGNQFMQSSQAQPADLNFLRGQFANQVGGQLGQQPNAAIDQLGQQALSLGQQGLDTQAPSDVEALRQQYGSLAGQAASNVLGSTADREAEVYNRIRATQQPEEERQRMALEERLFNQGRSGVSTNMYGSTPEQLAMAKAQAEAQNTASLSAIQQAQSERQQSLGEAQAFGGMFSQQAGLSSDLQNQAQQRAAQLSQLGLSANQIQSQLQSEGLGRAATSASQAGQLAQLAGDLQAQQAGLGAQMTGLGSQLGARDLAAQQMQQQLAFANLTGAYAPQNQLLAVQQASQLYPQLAQRGQLQGAGLFGEASMGGLEAYLGAGLGRANLLGTLGSGLLSGIFK